MYTIAVYIYRLCVYYVCIYIHILILDTITILIQVISLRNILRIELNEDSSKAISIVSKRNALQLTPDVSIVKKTASIMKNLIKKLDTSSTHAATVSQIVDCYIEISAASMGLIGGNAKMRENRNPFWRRIKACTLGSSGCF